jgi:hypothetical protein
MTLDLLERTKKQLKRNHKLNEVCMTEVEQGILWLRKWGKKSFQDHTGEWVEVRCSGQPNFFNDEIEAIPHVIEEEV